MGLETELLEAKGAGSEGVAESPLKISPGPPVLMGSLRADSPNASATRTGAPLTWPHNQRRISFVAKPLPGSPRGCARSPRGSAASPRSSADQEGEVAG